MGCFGDREKGPPEPTAKWTYITLSDFKSTSSWNTVAYLWVWIMAIVAVAAFAADTFTAVNLLAFNKWTSKIEPALKIEYSRWIFAGCIIFSTILIVISWIMAIRAIRGGGIADSYMDPLAATLQSMRGSGWRRFLVFSNLTQSKKGTDYVAFFVYFSFQTAIRVIIAEGPRQVINGMTLYEVMQDRFFEGGESDKSNIEQFWANLQHLFNEDTYQALTICTMLFTLIIWLISALSLLISIILYVVFLWHYIPQSDGRLKIYCRRKVDKRLEKIVEDKVKAAIADEDKAARKAEQKAEHKAEVERKKTGAPPPERPLKFSRQPTLPTVPITPDPGMKKEDTLPEFTLARKDTSTTVSTLPLYSSRPPTRNDSNSTRFQTQSSQRSMHSNRPMPSRTTTQSSGFPTPSYEMDAPLLDNAGFAGHAGAEISRPPTAVSRQNSEYSLNRPGPARTMTQSSMGSQQTHPPMPHMGAPSMMISYTPMSRTNSPGPRQPVGPRMPIATPPPMDKYYSQTSDAPVRANTPDSYGLPRQDSNASFSRPPPLARQPTFGSIHSQDTSFSRPAMPASSMSFNRPFSPPSGQDQQPLPYPNESFEMTPQPYVSYTPAPAASHTPSPPPADVAPQSYVSYTPAPASVHAPSPPPADAPPATSGYVAFNPSMHSASSTPAPQRQIPQRSFTASPPAVLESQSAAIPPIDVPQRSVTAPITSHLTPDSHAPAFDNRATIGYSDIVDDYGRPNDAEGRDYSHARAQNWQPRR